MTASVGNLFNGSTVRGSLSSSDAANALRYGYRSDDYNLQNIAAGTRVQVDMTSSFDNYLQVVDSNGRLVTYNDDGGPGLNARLDFIYQDWLPDSRDVLQRPHGFIHPARAGGDGIGWQPVQRFNGQWLC